MLRCIVLLVLTCVLLFSGGCVGDYFPYTIVSSVTGDGSGGAIIAYEIDRSYGDQDICIQRTGTEGDVLKSKLAGCFAVSILAL